jgi:hypothetical protein
VKRATGLCCGKLRRPLRGYLMLSGVSPGSATLHPGLYAVARSAGSERLTACVRVNSRA